MKPIIKVLFLPKEKRFLLIHRYLNMKRVLFNIFEEGFLEKKDYESACSKIDVYIKLHRKFFENKLPEKESIKFNPGVEHLALMKLKYEALNQSGQTPITHY